MASRLVGAKPLFTQCSYIVHWSIRNKIQWNFHLYSGKTRSETRQFMMTSSNGNIFRVTGLLCGDSPVTGEFPSQRPVTQSFDVFFYLRLNKQQSKQSWSWWFETPSRPLWRHCNVDDLASCLTRLSSVVVLINSLTPGRCPRNFDRLIFKCITQKLVKLFSCECHRCLPMRSQHWS